MTAFRQSSLSVHWPMCKKLLQTPKVVVPSKSALTQLLTGKLALFKLNMSDAFFAKSFERCLATVTPVPLASVDLTVSVLLRAY